MSTNNTTNGDDPERCDFAGVIAVVGWNVLGVGVVSNLLLLYFVLKKLAAGKRNDKLFLLNIIATNFFSIFGSLLGEILSRGKTIPSAQNYCIFFNQVNFISLFTNLVSMTALCYDRYENVTKFPGQRKLSFGKSIKVVVVGWVLVLVLVPCAQSGFIVTSFQGRSICKAESSRAPVTPNIASFFTLIVLVSVWITVNVQMIRISLSAIYSKLKQHRQQTEQVLGTAKTAKEVNLKKQALAMLICYSLCWIPYGFAAGLTAANVISFHSCFYFGCLVGAHASAATTPLVYLTLDKRFRFKFGTSRKENNGHSPATTVSP